jgi:trehalose/maltose transport system substrate-binding protein
MSVRKPSQPLGFSVWIENNIIARLKEEQRHLDNALFTNSMQARETNIYMDYAAKLLSEGLLDVYDLDIVYARRFAAHATDLYTIPFFKELAKGLDRNLLNAYTSSDEKKLIAFPWTKNQGILEPLQDSFTWERMEEIASDIISKEGNKIQGYAWQGKAYEGLTCNFMEWIASDGVESRIIDGEKITFDQESIDLASHSLERVARWLEKNITLPSVSNGTEIIGRDDFVNGKTLFFRYVRYKTMLLTLFKVLTGHLLLH